MVKASVKGTKLHGWHVSAGARMADFSGWDMPIQYAAGPREEHLRVREAAGLFDIDHMGRFAVSGPAALDVLQGIQTWDVSTMPPGSAHYSMLCSETGGILDDIFIYRLEPGALPAAAAKNGKKTKTSAKSIEWLVVVNAGNRKKDLAWLKENSTMYNVEFRDISGESCMIALQGPASRRILQTLADADLGTLAYHGVRRLQISGASCLVCTTGYTGEPGYEMMIPADDAERIWGAIMSAGAPYGLLPCGLAARDTLRAEACLPLYGHELTEATDPFSAGLGSAAVSLKGHDFMGRHALKDHKDAGGRRKIACFRMKDPSVPRSGYAIRAQSRDIGIVTTGLFSPSTGGYVGIGYVDAEYSQAGTAVDIVIRDSPKPALIVPRPFYKSPHWGWKEAPAAPEPVKAASPAPPQMPRAESAGESGALPAVNPAPDGKAAVAPAPAGPSSPQAAVEPQGGKDVL